MKVEVCSHCDNCGEGGVCARYKKPIAKVGPCGVYAGRKFNKPFNGKGVKQKIEYREAHESPLHLGKGRA